MAKKRAKDSDDEDSDPWDKFSAQMSSDDPFDQAPKKQKPDPHATVYDEEVNEEPQEQAWQETDPPVSTNDELPPNHIVPRARVDDLVIIPGCPLCKAQVGVKCDDGYVIKSVGMIDKILFDTTFHSSVEETYSAIASVMNQEVREELMNSERCVLMDCTVEIVAQHFIHAIDPAMDMKQLAVQNKHIISAIYGDIKKVNPVTKRPEVNYVATREWRAHVATHAKIILTDTTKANGYRVGATAANPNRLKNSVVQVALTKQ